MEIEAFLSLFLRFFEGRNSNVFRIRKAQFSFPQLERSEIVGTHGVQWQLRSIGRRMHTRFSRGHHLFTSLCVPTSTHDNEDDKARRESGKERHVGVTRVSERNEEGRGRRKRFGRRWIYEQEVGMRVTRMWIIEREWHRSMLLMERLISFKGSLCTIHPHVRLRNESEIFFNAPEELYDDRLINNSQIFSS